MSDKKITAELKRYYKDNSPDEEELKALLDYTEGLEAEYVGSADNGFSSTVVEIGKSMIKRIISEGFQAKKKSMLKCLKKAYNDILSENHTEKYKNVVFGAVPKSLDKTFYVKIDFSPTEKFAEPLIKSGYKYHTVWSYSRILRHYPCLEINPYRKTIESESTKDCIGKEIGFDEFAEMLKREEIKK